MKTIKELTAIKKSNLITQIKRLKFLIKRLRPRIMANFFERDNGKNPTLFELQSWTRPRELDATTTASVPIE